MAAPEADFPEGVPEKNVPVGGQPFTVPQFYYDWSFFLAHFPASAREVRKLLPTGLKAVEIIPGTAVVSLAAYEYRKARTLQPYNEAAILVPVRHAPKSNVPLLPLLWPEDYDVGFWVHYLPVDTQQARDAGKQVWGFPKVIADITFKDVGWMRKCTVRQDGERVFTFSSSVAETRAESRPFYAFSVLGGKLLKTLIDTRGQYHVWSFPGGASFELGTHRVAGELRTMKIRNVGLSGVYATSARSRLHAGEEVGAAAPVAGAPEQTMVTEVPQ